MSVQSRREVGRGSGREAEAVSSQTRLRVVQQLGPDMLLVVCPGELPGALALAFYDGEFRLFVSADALEQRPPRTLAHDAAHMIRNMRGDCDSSCDEYGWRLEESLSAVFALAHLAGA